MLRLPKPPNQIVDRIQGLFVIAFLVFIGWLHFSKKPPVTNKPELVIIHNGDTLQIDISGWDSTKIDSLMRTFTGLTKAQDSLNAVYAAKYKPELDALDSMMKSPGSPVADSLLKEFNSK